MTAYNEVYIFRIDCDPVCLIWSGAGGLLCPADTVIGPVDAIALGGGALVNLPDFEQLINGTAQRIDYQLSGVSQETTRLALEDAPTVKNARVDIGRMDLDADLQQIAPIEWEWSGQARSLSVSRGVATGGQSPQRSITLTVASGDTRRSRAPNAFFTDADQRRTHPTDAIFSHVAGINGGTSRRFGPSDA